MPQPIKAEPSANPAAVRPAYKPVAAAAASAPKRITVVIQSIVVAVVATLLLYFKKPLALCLVLYAISALMLIGGLFIPPLHRFPDWLGNFLGRVVGHTLTWLLLVPFFYIFFTSARLILRLCGKDPLTRRFDRNATSYWVDRPPVTSPDHYSRQF